MTSLHLRANAKINLHLDVGPLRKDGYHELKTLFQEISLHDKLTFRATKGPILLTSNYSHLSSGRDNIVCRALELLKRKLKVHSGISVQLEKKIPMGAGLGGGSSDAAAALKAGWALWKKGKPARFPRFDGVPPVLLPIAKKIGADVPFFLTGGTAWGEGRGEKLKPVPSGPVRWFLLVYPRIHVSTAEAYRLLDQSREKETRRKRARPAFPFPSWGRVGERGTETHTPHPALSSKGIGSLFFNSFEPVILKKYPAIARAEKRLVELGCADVRLSGSGSTVYGFVKDLEQGSRVFNLLQDEPWDVFLAHTVSK